MIANCPVCGGTNFSSNAVLWSDLVQEWQLAPYEVEYINRQQGFCCSNCGNNLRSITLANAILSTFNFNGTLIDFLKNDNYSYLKILEINEAGTLTPVLRKHRGHKLICYPEYDIMKLGIESSSYDIVVHSDTLEHVQNPVTGLSECKRILKAKGYLFFTIPIIVDRLTRSRAGLETSYHGSPNESDKALIVHTEYGSDFWKHIFLAGFSNISIHTLEYPSSFAISATA